MNKKHAPIGEILKEAGLITETHLRSALAQQKRFGGRIGEHLINAALITPQQLLDALSHQLGVAKINFKKSHIYEEALRLVPREVCARFQCIPVAVKSEKGHRKLLLAMSDPTNFEAIQEIEFRSAHTIVTALASETDIAKAIKYCYHIDGLRESHGLEEIVDVIELDTQLIGSDDEPIIINPEGDVGDRNKKFKGKELHALVDLLIEKGVFSRAELRDRVEKFKAQV